MEHKELADKARQAFFAEIFKHLPEGTSGDIAPDSAHSVEVFERLSEEIVRLLAKNAPEQKYFVLYECTWIPDPGDDPITDPPMDMTHSLQSTDSRVKISDMVAIGDFTAITGGLAEWLQHRK